eukprot:scaffold4518_cov410-Prasinococcus_capsulatus_cf.AAC.1
MLSDALARARPRLPLRPSLLLDPAFAAAEGSAANCDQRDWESGQLPWRGKRPVMGIYWYKRATVPNMRTPSTTVSVERPKRRPPAPGGAPSSAPGEAPQRLVAGLLGAWLGYPTSGPCSRHALGNARSTLTRRHIERGRGLPADHRSSMDPRARATTVSMV